MTFHARSMIVFGEVLARLGDPDDAGGRLETASALIAGQFAGAACALVLTTRAGRDRSALTLASGETLAESTVAARLAEFSEEQERLTVVSEDREGECRLTLTLFRPHGAAADAEERALAALMAGQTLRAAAAAEQRGETELECAVYATVMDRLSVGVILVDETGRVVKCTAAARGALAQRDCLQIHAGRLRALSHPADRELQAAIRQALGEEGAPRPRGLSLTRPEGGHGLGLVIQPVEADRRDRNGARAAIFLRDPDMQMDVENDLVRDLFDLTPAEAAVARRLALGLSLEDAAQSLDISRNTARAHLRSIFSKSGITRQTELVRMMLNSAVILGCPPRRADGAGSGAPQAALHAAHR